MNSLSTFGPVGFLEVNLKKEPIDEKTGRMKSCATPLWIEISFVVSFNVIVYSRRKKDTGKEKRRGGFD